DPVCTARRDQGRHVGMERNLMGSGRSFALRRRIDNAGEAKARRASDRLDMSLPDEPRAHQATDAIGHCFSLPAGSAGARIRIIARPGLPKASLLAGTASADRALFPGSDGGMMNGCRPPAAIKERKDAGTHAE